MSKIGRRPIELKDVQVEIKGQEIHYKGKNHSGVYILPDDLKASLEGNSLIIATQKESKRGANVWGLHRALLANALKGAAKDFEQLVEIEGLGYKCQQSENNIVCALGFSHKITMELPKEVKLSVDKSGQKLAFSSFDKEKLGEVCAKVRSLRPPEPYKGTGIRLAGEKIKRKAGKAKAAGE